MDNTPSHLNLPKRIHWNELTGNMLREIHSIKQQKLQIPFKLTCITYPPQKVISHKDFDFCSVLNLDAICNCGKSYKEHSSWKEELERQNKLYKI